MVRFIIITENYTTSDLDKREKYTRFGMIFVVITQ